MYTTAFLIFLWEVLILNLFFRCFPFKRLTEDQEGWTGGPGSWGEVGLRVAVGDGRRQGNRKKRGNKMWSIKANSRSMLLMLNIHRPTPPLNTSPHSSARQYILLPPAAELRQRFRKHLFYLQNCYSVIILIITVIISISNSWFGIFVGTESSFLPSTAPQKSLLMASDPFLSWYQLWWAQKSVS